MSTISKQGPARKRARANDYHFKLSRRSGELSLVDQAVERRLRHAAQRRHLRHLMQKLLRELGGSSKTLTDLEQLLADVQTERERAYFNLGFEHGVAGALARSRLEPVLDSCAKELSAELRERLVHASLPAWQAVLALADCLWTQALSMRK